MRIEFTDEQKKRISRMINYSYCWGISKHHGSYRKRLIIYLKAKDMINGFEIEDYSTFMECIKRQHKKEVIDMVIERINSQGYYSSKEIAHRLDVYTHYIWVLYKKNQLKAVKFGKRLYFCNNGYIKRPYGQDPST